MQKQRLKRKQYKHKSTKDDAVSSTLGVRSETYDIYEVLIICDFFISQNKVNTKSLSNQALSRKTCQHWVTIPHGFSLLRKLDLGNL